MPSSRAREAAWVREGTSSLRRKLATGRFMVWGLRTNACAISLLVTPEKKRWQER
jgi:hypothetical protein